MTTSKELVQVLDQVSQRQLPSKWERRPSPLLLHERRLEISPGGKTHGAKYIQNPLAEPQVAQIL